MITKILQTALVAGLAAAFTVSTTAPSFAQKTQKTQKAPRTTQTRDAGSASSKAGSAGGSTAPGTSAPSTVGAGQHQGQCWIAGGHDIMGYWGSCSVPGSRPNR